MRSGLTTVNRHLSIENRNPMSSSVARLSFFLLLISFFIVMLGVWYMTGISVKYFALATKDHFIAFFKVVVNFFDVF